MPQLIEALKDEFLYVRICAAGALGSIGPKAQTAREALRVAASDPVLRHEVEWALNRIAGVESGKNVVSTLAPALSIAPSPEHNKNRAEELSTRLAAISKSRDLLSFRV